MSDFKLIAIKTGNNSKYKAKFRDRDQLIVVDHLKNLKPSTIYPLYNHYSFPNGDFSAVNFHPEREIDIHTIRLSNGKKIPINICAIVGENGSGKSTLTELIYWINYNLGCHFKLLKYEDRVENNEIVLEDYLSNNMLDIQVLYTTNENRYFILKMENGDITQLQFQLTENVYIQENEGIWSRVSLITELSNFFYSLVVNYSQYGLNALEMGEWINPLFHKNDGYQTPIVLNPKRDNGDIDINNEKRLLSRRLQANVLEIVSIDENHSLRNLGNNKIAKKLRLSFNYNYFVRRQKEYGEIKPGSDAYKGVIIALNDIIKKGSIASQNIAGGAETNFEELRKNITKYVYYKLIRIIFTYPLYSSYREKNKIKKMGDLLNNIWGENSHIFFKLKGAILHLLHCKNLYPSTLLNFKSPFEIDIEETSKKISNIANSNKANGVFVNTFMMAMPSFFDVEILPEHNLSIETLSSGEKQRLFSLSSIAYHLANLNSVEKQKSETYAKYKYINIVLDEIELYFHPEWQRRYISDLLNYISKISPDNLDKIEGINIVFVTHSPFILSDIPNDNILRLKDGKPQPYEKLEKTFGANIHDLLANDFFMEEGFMGDWAKEKINETIYFINYSRLRFEIEIMGNPKNEDETKYLELKKAELAIREQQVTQKDLAAHVKLIKVIGEPILQQKLAEMMDELTGDKLELDIIRKRILELQKLETNLAQRQ